MHFNANNETVSLLLLLGLTVFMVGVRVRKPLENNWLLFYWLLLAMITLTRQEGWFDFRFIGAGLIAGLMLRFEFMNRTFTRFVMVIELVAFRLRSRRGLDLPDAGLAFDRKARLRIGSPASVQRNRVFVAHLLRLSAARADRKPPPQ